MRGQIGGNPITPARVSSIIQPGKRVDDLAEHLAAIADQNADAASVTITMQPLDLLRVSRLIAPLGGSWPREQATEAGYVAGFTQGLVLGICGMLAILGLWGGAQ